MHPTQAQALEALKKIADPLEFLQRADHPSPQIDGVMALQLANDPNWLKSIAREAIAALSSPSSTVMDEKGEREAFESYYQDEYAEAPDYKTMPSAVFGLHAWQARAALHSTGKPQAIPSPAVGAPANLERDYARALDAINGHVERIKALEQQARELQAFKDGVELHQRGGSNSWYWLDDRENYLETMVASLPVVIRAEQLRALLASQPPAQSTQCAATADAPVAELTDEDLDSIYRKSFGLIDSRLVPVQRGFARALIAADRVKHRRQAPEEAKDAAHLLVADLLDHINTLSEKLGDAAPDQRDLLSKVHAWLEKRDQQIQAQPIALPGGRVWTEIQPVHVHGDPCRYCQRVRDEPCSQFVSRATAEARECEGLKDLRATGGFELPARATADLDRMMHAQQPVQARKPMPEEIPGMPSDWSVTVLVDAKTVLSIGHDWVSGATDFDENVILGAAKHLLSFIGYGLPDCGFVPPEMAELASYQPLKGTPPRHAYVDAARVYARIYGQYDGAPRYLPRTQAEADSFEPHAWVIAAMMQCFGDGWADGHAGGIEFMRLARAGEAIDAAKAKGTH